MTKALRIVVLALLLLYLQGCGELRYSKIAPEAKDFHPQRIALLPADASAFGEAKDHIDRLFAEVLAEKNWFAEVLGGGAIARRLETDAELRQTIAEYLAKRDKLSFSDPELSGRIGALTRSDALVLTRVDYWNYTTQEDTKVAKVSLSIIMIEAKTGKTIWTATHQRVSDYLIIKPDLADVAKALIREMVGYMPR